MLGVNKLGSMMKELSLVAKLSRVYTNHCVRATAITLWSNAGLANCHMMAISGHRNEQSLKSYNSSVVTKTRNDLQPPTTTYNHLQPPTTTNKNLQLTYNDH